MVATDAELGPVTLTLPTGEVKRRASRDGRPFWLARLPTGTRAGGRDLSGGLVCSEVAWEDRARAGVTHLELPADATKAVRLAGAEDGRPETVRVPAAELCEAAEGALAHSRQAAVLRRAAELLEAGDAEAAREALAAPDLGILAAPMRPKAGPAPQARPSPHDMVRAYESMGILPAWMPYCSADTRSATADVPARFAHVAVAEGLCVTRDCFQRVLAAARALPPRYGGTLCEHSIGYVADRIARPFSQARGRTVVEANGAAFDLTDELMDVPGTPSRARDGGEPLREVDDLGAAALAVDRLALVERLGMTAEEADAVADWMRTRFEADLALATGRVAASHVDALLRSPDAARLLMGAGVRVEHAVTGEQLGAGAAPAASLERPPATAAELLEWQCVRVASDDAWHVAREDALRLASATGGPDAGLLAAAREAYLADDWLAPRDRAMAAPTRERAERLLAVREMPHVIPARSRPTDGPSAPAGLKKPMTLTAGRVA